MAHAKIIKTHENAYQLRVDGQPFFIKGAGLELGPMELLAQCGGNTFRTWHIDNGQRSAESILDDAYSLGLKVCMGLELERERHGFDYSNVDAVAEQQAAIMADVIRLKGHLALLMWGLGNELNLCATNSGVWDAVESLRQAIKAVDSDNLITTMLAGVDKPTPPTPACLLNTSETTFQFQITEPGEYRLYCQVDNSADASGVANIPFLVSDIQVANQPTQPASKPSTSANNNKVNKL